MNLLTYLQLDTKDFDAGVSRAQSELSQVGTSAAAAGSVASKSKLSSLTKNLDTVKPAADKAVVGLNAAAGASSMLSGSVEGAASGSIALGNAIKGLGVAASMTSVILGVGLIAAIALLAKTLIDARARSKQLTESIQFGNAQAGLDTLRRGFERLVQTMEGSVALMRELRALTREGADIDTDKRLAQIELDRARELAELDPDDQAGARAVHTRHDRRRSAVEFDAQEASNTAAAAEMRQRQQENADAIAKRRQQMERHLNESDAASAKAISASQKAAEMKNSARSDYGKAALVGGIVGVGVKAYSRKKEIEPIEQSVKKWQGVAQENVTDAQRLREEIEELERKNKILDEQAALYEKRNEVVAIRRQAAGLTMPDPDAAPDSKAEKSTKGGISSALSVATDRLTRLGGMTNAAGPNRMESLADKQLSEARQTRQLLERIARREPGTILG